MDSGGLAEAWINLNSWRTDEYIPSQCNSCVVRTWCRGGCRTEAYSAFGDLSAPDPYCDFSHNVLPQTPTKKVDVDVFSKYFFHPGIKSRRESFGGILFVTPVRWTGVNMELYNFFQSCYGKSFYLRDLAFALGLKSEVDVINTVRFLLSRSLVRKGGEKNES